ncbi:polymerase II polypeptide I, 14.5kDa [Piromyces finnis]|uniref:DNA-directed RNA polymerase subunit n=1 Tax=Piromyces finnis TaxID=1754191 RepID=A0A1Y1VF54_9FUNG|nr:polymerase II polypeptide I, 14.5kDa [Piromyces finnis]|eukprot:ORX53873.1 polymerase II polypeptide I, 14.5kDa [Piromyces finnis]
MASFHFCAECNNLLYPKEDPLNKQLLYACRNCEHQEEADNQCVYRHEVQHIPIEETMVITDLSADPTYPRDNNHPCPKCGHEVAVYFQSRSRRADTSMRLYFACCNKDCGHRWFDA